MNKTSTIILRGLLATSLATLICSVFAQDPLSSFEQALRDTGWSVQKTTSGDLLLMLPEQADANQSVPATVPVGLDIEKLADELEASGWQVQRKADGDLVLIPRGSSVNSEKRPTATEEQWQQMQKKLQEAGWQAERETDGSLLLTPPGTAVAAKPTAAKPETINQETRISNTYSFQSMQQKLRDTGWHVTNNSDGSILLYPPGKHVADEPLSKKPAPCPGLAPSVVISLPVDSWQEAHDIARDWLKKQPPFYATVGKIRKIFDIYLVSIVSSKKPYILKQQIAIRNSDGAVIVLN